MTPRQIAARLARRVRFRFLYPWLGDALHPRPRPLAPARLVEWSRDHLLGEHRGYLRLADGVVHRRRVERRAAGVWEINDRFEGSGEHRFALNLQLAPGCMTQVAEAAAEARWPDGTRLVIRCSGGSPARAEIAKGWISPGWNRRKSAPRYIRTWTSAAPLEHRTLLELVPAND